MINKMIWLSIGLSGVIGGCRAPLEGGGEVGIGYRNTPVMEVYVFHRVDPALAGVSSMSELDLADLAAFFLDLETLRQEDGGDRTEDGDNADE